MTFQVNHLQLLSGSNMSRIRIVFAFLCLLGILPASAAPAIDPAELEAFVDGVVHTTMRQNNIVGATVAITQKDQVILLKGYGFADKEKQLPVDPESTLFRIGSVSKLFTWTGLMQLREQGKLDLDTDVNEYLTTLTVPDTFPEPVTLRHLMSHSGGIEDRIVQLFGDEVADMQPYAEILSRELPDRVRAPGTVSTYSNHGVGLAGLVLEEVSGEKWGDYVQQHILDPLQMSSATAFQPVPEELAGQLSQGYAFELGKHVEKPFEYVPLGAAGGMSASALAMTRFARAHLGDGSVDGQRILSGESVALMREPLFDEHESINTWLYGFDNYSRGDTFIYGHSGGTLRFFTEFVLVPEYDISVFVSTNTTMGFRVIGAVLRGVLDRYLPDPMENVEPLPLTDLDKIAGHWSTYRHPVTTPDKIIRALQTVVVQPVSDNELMVTGLAEHPTYWRQVAPLEFKRVDGNVSLVFQTDASPPRMLVGSVLSSYYKISWIESTNAQVQLLIVSLLMVLWVLLAWPVQWFKRRPSRLHATHGRAQLAGWLMAVAVMVVVGLSATLNDSMVFGLGTPAQVLLLVTYLVPLLVLVQLVIVARLYGSDVGRGIKFFHSLLVLIGLYLSWLLYYWNFYGPYPW